MSEADFGVLSSDIEGNRNTERSRSRIRTQTEKRKKKNSDSDGETKKKKSSQVAPNTAKSNKRRKQNGSRK